MKRMSWKECLAAAFLLWATIAGIDRIVWVKSGAGLGGFISSGFVADTHLPGCEGRGIEFKVSEGGTIAYRCNTYDGNGSIPVWPFQRSGESAELSKVIAQVFQTK